MRDEMVCDRCERRHDVVWFAPSDVWNLVMRDGDRANPDRYSFCCPICFIQLAEEAGVQTTAWLVAPEGRLQRDAVFWKRRAYYHHGNMETLRKAFVAISEIPADSDDDGIQARAIAKSALASTFIPQESNNVEAEE